MSILSCSVSNKKIEPDWVHKRPSKSDYYIGIGTAKINKSFEDAKIKSFENAINEISNQIQLYFESETISKLEELQKNDIILIYDYIKTESKLSTKLEIRDIEIVDYWNDNNGVYCYLKLSKIKAKKMIANENNKRLEICKSNIDFAEDKIDNFKPWIAIELLLENYYNAIMLEGTIIDSIEILTKYQNLLFNTINNLNIEQIEKDDCVATLISFKTKPIKKIPIIFSQKEEQYFAMSDKNGVASIEINRLKSIQENVKASFDLSHFVKDYNYNIYLLEKIKSKFSKIIFKYKPKIKYIFLKGTNSLSLQKEISSFINETKEYQTTIDTIFFDFQIRIDLQNEKGSNNYGLFSSYSEYKIEILREDGTEFFFEKGKVKGMGNSWKQALFNSDRNCNNEIINKLKTQIIGGF